MNRFIIAWYKITILGTCISILQQMTLVLVWLSYIINVLKFTDVYTVYIAIHIIKTIQSSTEILKYAWLIQNHNTRIIEWVIVGVIYYILSDVDITTINIQQCIKCVYDTGQENAQILSYVNMTQELIAARDGFKINQNLCKNEIIEFIFYISTIDVI